MQRDFFVQEHDRKQDADKGRECVKGAGFCGSQVFLRADVGENAQTVSHKAEQQGERDVSSNPKASFETLNVSTRFMFSGESNKCSMEKAGVS